MFRYENTGQHFVDRWEKLLVEYKKTQDNNRRTGAERMEFEYQEEIQDIVIDDPVFNEVYDSAKRRETNMSEKKKREKRNETLEMIAQLHEQNRNDNREFQSRLLTVLETFLSSIGNQAV